MVIDNGEGGLASVVNINLPKRPDWGLVVRSKIALRNPLSPNIARTARLNSAGVGFTPYLISSAKPIQRTIVRGTAMTQ